MMRILELFSTSRRNTTRRSYRRANALCEVACLEERVLLTAISMTDYEQLLLELINQLTLMLVINFGINKLLNNMVKVIIQQ